jgi:predicted ester cyclase
MDVIEQKNMEIVSAFLHDKQNESKINVTDQFFSAQITEAFTERKYEVDEIFVRAEKVIARIVITAVNKGEFAGNKATGKIVKLTQYREFQVIDGKIVSHKGWFDTGTLLPQLQS